MGEVTDMATARERLRQRKSTQGRNDEVLDRGPLYSGTFIKLAEGADDILYCFSVKCPEPDEMLIGIFIDDLSILTNVTADPVSYERGIITVSFCSVKPILQYVIQVFPEDETISLLLYTEPIGPQCSEEKVFLHFEWFNGNVTYAEDLQE